MTASGMSTMVPLNRLELNLPMLFKEAKGMATAGFSEDFPSGVLEFAIR